jgi:hypothetical protein
MSRDPFESWFDSQKDIWPSQWHAAQAAWHAAQEQPSVPALSMSMFATREDYEAASKAVPRAPLSDEQVEAAVDSWYASTFQTSPMDRMRAAIEAAIGKGGSTSLPALRRPPSTIK